MQIYSKIIHKMKSKKLFKDKKGSIIDPIVWVIVGFVTVVFLAMMFVVFTQFNNAMHKIPNTPGVNVSRIVEGTSQVAYNQIATNIKWLSYMILFAMILSIFIHNFLIRVHWAFIGLYIFISIIAVAVSVPLSNQYESLLSNELIGPTLQSWTGATFVMLYLPVFTIVIGLVGLIFLGVGALSGSQNGGSVNTDSAIL